MQAIPMLCQYWTGSSLIRNVSKENMQQIWGYISDYRQVSNIRRALVGNKIVDNSDIFGASPVGAAPTTSSFST